MFHHEPTVSSSENSYEIRSLLFFVTTNVRGRVSLNTNRMHVCVILTHSSVVNVKVRNSNRGVSFVHSFDDIVSSFSYIYLFFNHQRAVVKNVKSAQENTASLCEFPAMSSRVFPSITYVKRAKK